jgi:hypothetical protein
MSVKPEKLDAYRASVLHDEVDERHAENYGNSDRRPRPADSSVVHAVPIETLSES